MHLNVRRVWNAGINIPSFMRGMASRAVMWTITAYKYALYRIQYLAYEPDGTAKLAKHQLIFAEIIEKYSGK